MTPQDILPILQRWADAVTDAAEALDALRQVTGCCDEEAPIAVSIWSLCGIADHWAAECIGTAPDWMEWFRLENDMGAGGRSAGFDGDLRQIHTLQDFADLLAEDCRRAALVNAEAVH